MDHVSTDDELLELLDRLIEDRGADWWAEFYRDETRKCLFFTQTPNEDLIELVGEGVIKSHGRILDLGCGNGRNANYLAKNGFLVDGVDFSESAIALATENAASGASFICASIFDFDLPGPYDLVYDSGCFHHIAPHRRPAFLDLIRNALAPGGIFAMSCFAPGGGSDYTDLEVYEKRSMGGGLSFTEGAIRNIFAEGFEDITIRRMRDFPDGGGEFGKDFLWAVRMRRS